MSFSNKSYLSKRQQEIYEKSIRGRYMDLQRRRPFLMFGLPFILLITAGSLMLSQFTAIRYEQHDRRVTQMSEDEALAIHKGRRKVDIKDEYYRLQQMDTKDWNQVRVPRFPGEGENKW